MFSMSMVSMTACRDNPDSWQRRPSTYNDRGLLFTFYGNESLDERFHKPDLFWGNQVNIPSPFLTIRREFTIDECVVKDEKLNSPYGSVNLKSIHNCAHSGVFNDLLISQRQGGKNETSALPIPKDENQYEIMDQLDAHHPSRWYRLNYSEKAQLTIETKSREILDGRLYFDSNENDKIDKEELFDVLSIEEKFQGIDAILEPGTYFFLVTQDPQSILIDLDEINGGQTTAKSLNSDSKQSNQPKLAGDETLPLKSSAQDQQTSFQLRFSTRYLPSYHDNAGNDPQSAFDFSPSESAISVHESIGNDDTVDFFKFYLTDPKELRIKLENLSGEGDADFELYRDINADGEVSENELMGKSEGTGTDVLSIPYASAGQWFLKIKIYQGSLTYNLEIQSIETKSSNLAILATKVSNGTKFDVVNLGPSIAKNVQVLITLSEGQFILTPADLKQVKPNGPYQSITGQISMGELISFVINGDLGSITMVEVKSSLPDSDLSNNALVKKL